jgi:predicted nuclease of predicted toxin-antitoxin system
MSRADDAEILERARPERRCVITLDADFHAILALSGGEAPSVIRIRTEGLLAPDIVEVVARVLERCATDLECGAAVTADAASIRVRRLPILPRARS